MRIETSAGGVSIWSPSLFSNATDSTVRAFLSGAFSVPEVTEVEIRRDRGFGRIVCGSRSDPSLVWRKLGRAFRDAEIEGPSSSAAAPGSERRRIAAALETLLLPAAADIPLYLSRIDGVLSTWRLRHRAVGRLRFAHPFLIRRKDRAFRLQEHLANVVGVRSARVSAASGSVLVAFDSYAITAAQIVRQLEAALPRILDGEAGPPSRGRLVAAGGLLGFAFAGQYLVPALRPIAVFGVLLYGLPNVMNGSKQIARLQIGLPALYSAGLLLTLWTGLPFTSSVMAVLMQAWPRAAFNVMANSRRRMFSAHRRRLVSVRTIEQNGVERDIDLDDLRPNAIVTLRRGDVVPVDGIVEGGLAAVDERLLSGVAGAIDKGVGDRIFAGSFVHDGDIRVRVLRIADTAIGEVASRLPDVSSSALPSLAAAERIANRNAKPALALAAFSILVRRLLRPAQAIIRPDYATASRLGARMAALHDFGSALDQGILFRNIAALDRLAATDVFVFDDCAALDRRGIEVAQILCDGSSQAEVLGLAAASFSSMWNERAIALLRRCARWNVSIPSIHRRERRAGAISFYDASSRKIEIAAPGFLDAANIATPRSLSDALSQPARGGRREDDLHASHESSASSAFLQPLWVIRDNAAIGVVTFERSGEYEAAKAIASLKAADRRARFVHISSHRKAVAEARARELGIQTTIAGLGPEAKAAAVAELGPGTLWIGNGGDPTAPRAMRSSAVSISAAGFESIREDAADIVFLHPSLESLVTLRQIAREHEDRLQDDYKVIYAANLLGAVGGWFMNFSSMHSGLTSNVGTGYVYLRHRNRLLRLAERMEGTHSRAHHPIFEERTKFAGKRHVRAIEAIKNVDYREVTATQP